VVLLALTLLMLAAFCGLIWQVLSGESADVRN